MADLMKMTASSERSLSMPLYEIFLPLYKIETERSSRSPKLRRRRGPPERPAYAVGGAWLVVGSAACTLLVLFAIVYRGSLTIGRHRATIKKNIMKIASPPQQ